MKAYRKPREFGWLSGMALLGLASVFGFSGYLLPMDELSYFATKVGLQIPAAIPWIGPAHRQHAARRPGRERVYRAALLCAARGGAPGALSSPARLSSLAGAAPRQRRRRPAKKPCRAAERKTMPFMPNFLRKDLAMWLISLNILALLASVFPWSLGKPFDPLAPAPAGHSSRVVLHESLRDAQAAGLRRCRGEAGRDCRHSALHAGHRALDSDSLLRQRARNRDSAPAPRTTSACWRSSPCWPPPSSAIGRFGKISLACVMS